MIRELIEYCRRRGRDEELVAKVRAERPQVAWPGAPAPQAAQGAAVGTNTTTPPTPRTAAAQT